MCRLFVQTVMQREEGWPGLARSRYVTFYSKS